MMILALSVAKVLNLFVILRLEAKNLQKFIPSAQ